MRKLNDFLEREHPSGLVDKDYLNPIYPPVNFWLNKSSFIYISKNGNDSNSGNSWANSKLTIQGAIDSIPKSSSTQGVYSLFISGGTYTENIIIPYLNVSLFIIGVNNSTDPMATNFGEVSIVNDGDVYIVGTWRIGLLSSPSVNFQSFSDVPSNVIHLSFPVGSDGAITSFGNLIFDSVEFDCANVTYTVIAMYSGYVAFQGQTVINANGGGLAASSIWAGFVKHLETFQKDLFVYLGDNVTFNNVISFLIGPISHYTDTTLCVKSVVTNVPLEITASDVNVIANDSAAYNATNFTAVNPLRSLQIAGKVMSVYPTTDPHIVGALWNNAGVVTVSAG